MSDGGVFKNYSIYTALQNNTLNIPKPTKLPGSRERVPYVLVADDAFALSNYLMKPYAQSELSTKNKIYNYRLSRARRTVENAFGILAKRFRVFMTPIPLVPEKVILITMASCILHNYLRSQASAHNVYTPAGSLDSEDPVTHQLHEGLWRQSSSNNGMKPIQKQGSNNVLEICKGYSRNILQLLFLQ